MSGRRSKALRRKIGVGAIIACTALRGDGLKADEPPPTPTHSDTPAKAQLPVLQFDIAPGPLAPALQAFERTTGINLRVRVPKEVLRELRTSGVSGSQPVEAALRELLAGTGATYRFTGRSSVTVDFTVTEAIDVEATLPSVSSPKYTEPLVDTPQTLTVIPSEVFAAQGATTLRDVLRNTPGITYQAGEGGGGLPGDTFTMRGFSAGNDIAIDGVRDVGAYSRDAFNLEQVEVAKGPTSTTSGRGSTGGSINLVTKTPKPEPFRRVTVAGGSPDHMRATFDLNESAGPAHLRVNGMWTDSGVPGRDVVRNSSWAFAPSLSLGLGSPSTVTLSYLRLEQDNVPDYGLPWVAFDASPRIDQSNFYGLHDYDYETIDSQAATAIVEHRFSDAMTLRNVSRWAATHRDSAITAPRPPNRQLQQRDHQNDQLVNQTSLTGSFHSGAISHRFVAGLEISRETTDVRRQAQTTNQPQTSIDSPNPDQDPFGPIPANVGVPGETLLNAAGVYAFDTIDIGSRWQLNGGLRYDDVDATFESVAATGQPLALARRDGVVSWRAAAVFKPGATGSLYAAYSTAFTPSVEAGTTGAAFSDAGTAANNPTLDPEKTRNLELGTKWELFNRRMLVTSALFRTEKTNARTRSASTDPFVLAGEQRVDGIEFGASGSITDRWSVFGAYAHMKSSFAKSANAAEEGAALAFTPENSFNVWTSADLGHGFSVGAGTQYMDGIFRNSTNTAAVPSYWLFDAMAAYRLNDRLTLRLNANNALDEQYVDRVGGGHYIPGARRSFVVSVEVGF